MKHSTKQTGYQGSDATDKNIDAYISALPNWQREVCNTVRRITHEADGNVMETTKRNDRPYFTLEGNICALQATKDHVNIFIYDPIAPDPDGLINQGQGNATARTIQVYEKDTLNQPALLHLLRAVIANNRAGGWRKLIQR